jgi:cell division protein FtsL
MRFDGPRQLEPAPRRSVAIAVLLIAVAALTALALDHVHLCRERIRLGYELSRERAELQALQEQNRRLLLERSMLRHPDRIERFAESLGMTHPDPGQIRVVPPATALPAPPQLADAHR